MNRGWGRRGRWWRRRWRWRSQLLLLWGHVVVAAASQWLLLLLWGLWRLRRALERRLRGLLRRLRRGRHVLVLWLWLGRCLGVH